MDFDGAIAAHSSWKMKLSLYLKHPDGSLNVLEVEQIIGVNWENGCTARA